MQERSINGRDVAAFQNVRQITEGASFIKGANSDQWCMDVTNWFLKNYYLVQLYERSWGKLTRFGIAKRHHMGPSG